MTGISGTQSRLEQTHKTRGDEYVFLTIKRISDQLAGFEATWVSPVCYLLLDEPLGLFVDDETGIDRPGADEPELRINVDNDPFRVFSGSWDDADTGERWPNLDTDIRQRVQMRLPGAREVGFVDAIWISYVESDMKAVGWLNVEVAHFHHANPKRPSAGLACRSQTWSATGITPSTAQSPRYREQRIHMCLKNE